MSFLATLHDAIPARHIIIYLIWHSVISVRRHFVLGIHVGYVRHHSVLLSSSLIWWLYLGSLRPSMYSSTTCYKPTPRPDIIEAKLSHTCNMTSGEPSTSPGFYIRLKCLSTARIQTSYFFANYTDYWLYIIRSFLFNSCACIIIKQLQII